MAIAFKISENYFHRLRWVLSCWQLGGTYGSALIQAKSIAHLRTMRLWSTMSVYLWSSLCCFLQLICRNHLVLFTHISQLQKENYNAYIYITNGTSEVQTAKFVGHYSNQRVKYCQLARLFVKTCEIKHWTILCAVFFSFPDAKRNLGIYQVEVLRCG